MTQLIHHDHITITDNTALLVVSENEAVDAYGPKWANRPCDTCDGCKHLCVDGVNNIRCPDCVNGRHTFTVEVDYGSGNTYGGRTRGEPWGVEFRVHVIDVLPIVDETDVLNGVTVPAHHVIMRYSGEAWAVVGTSPPERITLPSAAEPGMWLVRLAVHT